ncbi:hypothetical protein SD457_21770 [Coprobacillaceae bacterium CR2/5/TPMF4]|nr:hypothetical protein SD457_21770 [Coprobacillaceae bacterium CR2/5/TPMF4]
MIIDSKFPLENYQKFIDEDTLEGECLKYEAAFRQDIKNISMIFLKIYQQSNC